MRPFLEVIDDGAVTGLAISTAEALNRKVESLDPELIERIERSGKGRSLTRARHRNDHLDEIERAM